MRASAVAFACLAAGLAAGSARADECRAASGQMILTAGATPFTRGLSGCLQRAQTPAGPAARPHLSPLLQLYETPRASVDVTLHARRPLRPATPPPPPPPSATVTMPRDRAPPRPKLVEAPRPPRGAVRVRYTPGAQPSARQLTYAPAILGVARAYDIDPALMGAVARRESGINPAARSKAGALGMMQVMPGTGARFGVRGQGLRDPVTNLAVGASYLKSLQRRYGNNLPLILAAYNAGEGAVDRHGRRIPPYRETQAYVTGILGDYGGAIRRRQVASR